MYVSFIKKMVVVNGIVYLRNEVKLMCKYCSVNDYGESYGSELGNLVINCVEVWHARIYGDESVIRISRCFKAVQEALGKPEMKCGDD